MKVRMERWFLLLLCGRDDFAIVSLSLDEKVADVRDYVNENGVA